MLDGANVYCGECAREWRTHGDAHKFQPERVEYLTDDRDAAGRHRMKLIILYGRNGDWYVTTCPEGERGIYGVRLRTSGGASSRAPGLCPGIAEAFRAIVTAHTGITFERI